MVLYSCEKATGLTAGGLFILPICTSNSALHHVPRKETQCLKFTGSLIGAHHNSNEKPTVATSNAKERVASGSMM